MHGIKSNSHVSTPQSNPDFGQNDKENKKYNNTSSKINKPRYGHLMADVEKQISDWQEEMSQQNK